MDIAGEIKGKSLCPRGLLQSIPVLGSRAEWTQGPWSKKAVTLWHQTSAIAIWQPAVKAAGLEGLKVKDMRKTAATNLL